MGLNDSYLQDRSQILLMTPLPSVNQGYAMIMNDEGQKIMISSSTGVFGAAPSTSYDPTSFYTKIDTQSYQKFKKDYSIQCDYCKIKVLLKKHCYRLVRYPPSFNKKKSILGEILVVLIVFNLMVLMLYLLIVYKVKKTYCKTHLMT